MSRINLNNYYKINELEYKGNLYELFEHECFGDEVPCVVTKNGVIIGETYDFLDSYVCCL